MCSLIQALAKDVTDRIQNDKGKGGGQPGEVINQGRWSTREGIE